MIIPPRTSTGPMVILLWLSPALARAEHGVEFNREIRPVLADNCFQCHGPDPSTREASLRLDTEEGFFAPRGTGDGTAQPPTVIKGRPDKSSLFQRIIAQDPDEIMPPPQSHKSLKSAHIARIKAWIEAGAPWQPHWSLLPPVAPTLPEPRGASWAKNPIDLFVLARMKKAGLEPAPEADARSLIRRIALDVTGLPPSPELLAIHLPRDGGRLSDTQVRTIIDQLMATSAYGEHRARYWLDAVRYGDSHGVHVDYPREMWPYRDWVIRALNANQPFDDFTVEQLAGDLLPHPTESQLIATGLQRCNVTTNEGGTISEENLANYAADRVQTLGWVFLGLTTNCAQCHDHKFDPITQRDFYALAAFFRNTTQPGLDGNARDGRSAVLYLPSESDRPRLNALPGEIAAATAAHESGLEQAGRLESLQNELEAIKARSPLTHIQEERKEMTAMAAILERGAYDRPGEQVMAEVPAALGKLPAHAPRNRLGLARWLISDANPLTARVTVNRMWQEIFGQGLVKTTEDFGIMGSAPSHPELLDWLAVEFRRSGWDMKAFYRLVLTSATYRQAAILTPEKLVHDHDNALFSRGPRFRMDAEMTRDLALAACGRLSSRQGGPGVKPYQPDGVWEAVNHSPPLDQAYVVGRGEDLYRRSVYSYWRRLAPPASLDLLNAPSRQVSCVRRERTNTPIQALVTLNDTQFVEAARLLAQDILARSGDDEGRLHLAAERVLARPLRSEELAIVLRSLETLRDIFANRPDKAVALATVGASEADSGVPCSELAAWTMVCNELLNLDETITK